MDRLLDKFCEHGLHLDESEREEFHLLQSRVEKLEKSFLTNLRKSSVIKELGESELHGVSSTFLSGLLRTEDGRFRVSLFREPSSKFTCST